MIAGILDRYRAVLAAQLAEASEANLMQAAALGRQLVASGVYPEEVGELHQRAMADLCAENPGFVMTPDVARAVNAPLLEMLMAFGLATRRLSVEQLKAEQAAESDQRSLRKVVGELALSQQQLVRAQKMESMGRLAGGVAHDFNNQLTVINSFTRFVLDELADGDARRDDLIEVMRAVDSASKLTNQLLSFARKRPTKPTSVAVGDAIMNLDRMMQRALGDRVELVTLPPPEDLHVLVDPGHFEQVLSNLVINACDAMKPNGGTLTIEAAFRETADGLDIDGAENGIVELRVTDTGCGIPAEFMEKIFEPFFTTKGEVGTGLGLATCYGIIRQAGGDLRVETEVGVGTTFVIGLPLVEPSDDLASVLVAEVRAESANSVLEGKRVLLVEDQPAILKTVARTLEKAGMVVVKARTAEEGLALSVQSDDCFDLVVTDVVLPGISGPEMLARLRDAYDDLRAVVTSGFIGDESAPPIETDDYTVFLPKPFGAPQLLVAVDRVMTPPRPAADGLHAATPAAAHPLADPAP